MVSCIESGEPLHKRPVIQERLRPVTCQRGVGFQASMLVVAHTARDVDSYAVSLKNRRPA
jgi:hypothetical protein